MNRKGKGKMDRRQVINGFISLGMCSLCAQLTHAAEDGWDYSAQKGPDHWSELDKHNFLCSDGSQQSPVDISEVIEADLPSLSVDWRNSQGKMINNGHTIQVNLPRGSMLSRGGQLYELLQLHFHAPSEHHADGRIFPMEAHFVHKHRETGSLGVLAVFLTPGASNRTFSDLAAAFPVGEGMEVLVEIDPSGLLPAPLLYWFYEGSLTTPPCSENVDWMVAKEPVEVGAGDIEKFTALYPMNARPIVSRNRRFILSSR